jgi:hypothetical protein
MRNRIFQRKEMYKKYKIGTKIVKNSCTCPVPDMNNWFSKLKFKVHFMYLPPYRAFHTHITKDPDKSIAILPRN